ncbi:MAG: DUF2059 domain-containing protein [Oceanospirillaceae bacterium]|nr:DUF2059 domain-containing protein [Oceanospirillaceae bacterium]MCP5335642.1 DUF2059 domain-containing protein [Oceanospirillaceae bacterium]
MKKSPVMAFVALLLIAPLSFADKTPQQEAQTLLELLHMDEALRQSIAQMVEGEIQQNPQLIPYRNVLQQFFTKYMGYENLKPELIELYTTRFSASELASINRFYSSATGQKLIAAMPEIMQASGELGEAHMRDNMAEFQHMIEAEAQRLNAQQKANEEPAF